MQIIYEVTQKNGRTYVKAFLNRFNYAEFLRRCGSKTCLPNRDKTTNEWKENNTYIKHTALYMTNGAIIVADDYYTEVCRGQPIIHVEEGHKNVWVPYVGSFETSDAVPTSKTPAELKIATDIFDEFNLLFSSLTEF